MKKVKITIKSGIISTLAYLLISTSLMAQAPQKMSYQAVIRYNSKKLVSNQKVRMQISIIQSSTNGSKVYVETQTANTNANGLVSIEIGSGTVVRGNFSTIDWSNGPFYIKSETDPKGGTNYSIRGTSQILTVPYALHANTADSVAGGLLDSTAIANMGFSAGTLNYTETDPIFGASTANGITGTDTTNWNNKLDSETDPIFVASIASGITGTDTSNWNNKLDSETDPSVPSGTQTGEMQYWNGSKWVTVPIGSDSATLMLVNNVPTWVGRTIPTPNVTSTTGEVWMDRNLGASQVAQSSTDALAYGDLYQWGRYSDGHEKRTNTSKTTTQSPTDTPGDSKFIYSHNDWRTTNNNSLWQGATGINNPCPTGYRIPTEAELNAEFQSWPTQDPAGAIGSLLKLPMPGYHRWTDGSIQNVGSNGFYWSSTVGTGANRMRMLALRNSPQANAVSDGMRANGCSVRCIKD